ncbi:MAG: GxxExxY protein [Terrimicrobiaceae bacterium]|nr:GxxExxY protein [Terrimicrobiaceae bacterium]
MNADSKHRDPETFAIIGAAMEVHRELGGGFLEAVYQDALAVEFASRRIPFEREKLLQVRYKGGVLPSFYKADFVCFGTVLVECKAIQEIGPIEQAQVLNHLRITGLQRSIIVNFSPRSLEYKRLVHSGSSICENQRESVVQTDVSL